MPRQKPSLAEKELKITISTNTLVRILVIVVGLAAIVYLQNIVAILLASLLFSAAIDPAASWLQRHRVKRGIAAALIYLAILAVFIGIGFLIVPTIAEQGSQLLDKYAPAVEELSGGQIVLDEVFSKEFFQQDFNSILTSAQGEALTDALPELISVIAEVFGGIVTLLLIIIISFYMVVEEDALKKGVMWLTPQKYEPMMRKVIPKSREQIGAWLRGQLFVMFIIFVVNFIVLTIIGIPYALVLALIAGLLEIVPFLGPILSAVPAVLLGFTLSPWHALVVALAYFGIQQLEGDVLTPKVMQKVGGVNPIVSIVALLIGFEFFGIIGALLAIPAAMVIGTFIQEIYSNKPLIKD